MTMPTSTPAVPPCSVLRLFFRLVLLVLAAALSGCGTPQANSPAPIEYAPPGGDLIKILSNPTTESADNAAPADLLELTEDGVPAPETPEPVPSGNEIGAVRPGLNLRISVLVGGQPEFEEPSRQVSSEGTIEAPLIGKVKVAGLNLQQVETLLEARYSQYLVQPQVVVEYVLREGSTISPWGYVTVLGRVRSPGKLPIPATRDLTVSGAIQRAGGFDTSARSSSIRVTRQLADGNTQRLKVDLKAYAKGNLEEDLLLRAGDVVFVPESLW